MKNDTFKTVKNRNPSTAIEGLEIIYFDEFQDERGRIWTSFEDEYVNTSFVMDKITISNKNVLRGFHGDSYITKYIMCLNGSFQFAALDLRMGSPTYGICESFIMKDSEPAAVIVPAGIVNAHLSLSDNCVFFYKWSKKYNGPENQVTISYKDPEIGIKWLVSDPIVSERDSRGIPFKGIKL